MSAALLASAVLACTQEAAPAPAANPAQDAAPVVLAVAEQREFEQPLEAIGTAQALESVTITARVSGHVKKIAFREGTRTAAGAVLVELENDEERAALAAAEAALEQAEHRNERLQELGRTGLVSADLLGEQSEALKTARANRALAQARLEQRVIRAPFAGQLGLRQLSEGALVQPGTPIVTLDQVDTLRVAFSVPETQLRFLAPETAVVATTPAYPDAHFEGVVSVVGSRVDPATRAISAQARIDNGDGRLKPGMLLNLTIKAPPRTALFVPEAALAPENSVQYLWRVRDDDTVERVEVAIGARTRGQVEIVSGIEAGQRVVVEGVTNLRPGRRVKPIQRDR